MRWKDIYIAGVGAYLPAGEQTAEQAVAEGLYDATAAETNGIRAVRVARGTMSPASSWPHARGNGRWTLRTSAGRRRPAAARVRGASGPGVWSPAHYVQQETGCHGASARWRSPGFRTACSRRHRSRRLAPGARPDARAALMTSVTPSPAVHRPVASDDQTVFGDGAARR